MNILFVSTDYVEPGRSSTGLPNYLKRITAALSENGNKVMVVYGTAYNQLRLEDEVEIFSVRIPNIPIKGNDAEVARKHCLITGYYLNEKVNWILANRKVDIIQYVSLFGIGLFYNSDVPAVIRLSSYTKFAYANSYGTLSQECIDEYSDLEVKAAKHIGNVFGPSEPTAEAFETDYGSKVDIIESPFSPIDSIDDRIYKKQFDGKKYALFFGKMYAEKGIFELCGALEDFLKMKQDYYFAFIGGDSTINGQSVYSIIKDKAGECVNRVIILSELNHSQLFFVVHNAKFIVLPSYMENFSNACMEAMYYNGCVVATKDAGFEQLIDDSISGFLCNKQDKDDLFQTMMKVASLDEEQLSEIRKRARERIEKNSPQLIVDRLIEYYEHVVEEWSGIDDSELQEYHNEIAPFINDENIVRYAITDADKRYLNSRALARWARMLISGSDPVLEFFKDTNYKSVAVYGLMDIGTMLIDGLEQNGIEIKYTIDRNVGARYKNYPIYRPSDDLPNVDLIIITPISYYFEIMTELKECVNTKIISVEELLFP